MIIMGPELEKPWRKTNRFGNYLWKYMIHFLLDMSYNIHYLV